MGLVHMMTQTASTTRHPAMASGKTGSPVANLTGLKITKPMSQYNQGDRQLRQALGMDGTLVQEKEAYTESHAHTDSGTPVIQMPDIVAGDKLIVGSVTYNVEWVDIEPATSGFGETMILKLTQDKRG